jgi:hypothetical protein
MDGSKGAYQSFALYDCRLRGWYKAVKKAKTPVWATPFISLAYLNYDPTITLVKPFFVNSANTSTYYGSVGANIYLSAISKYLKGIYANTDRQVFIVDKTNGYLIGTSISDAMIYAINSVTKAKV